MLLSVASPEPSKRPRRAVKSADCACDIEKTSVVRAYIQAHFPNCAIREFHSRSTVRYGCVPVPYADHHVISLSEDRPCCAVLTPEFFEQVVEGLGERLRHWHLASALVAEGVVIVGRNGIAPL